MATGTLPALVARASVHAPGVLPDGDGSELLDAGDEALHHGAGIARACDPTQVRALRSPGAERVALSPAPPA